MKKHLIVLLTFFLLSACAAPTPPADAPKPADTQLVIPTRLPFPTRISTSIAAVTPTAQPGLLDGTKFLATFSSAKADWQIVPGNVTAAQLNEAVALLEGDQMHRTNQKVLNGFLRTTVKKADGQVYEVLVPAESVNGKLKELKVKSVGQTPVLASHAVLLEDYFAINFPDVVAKWEAQGARYEDFKYAAVVTVTWATKYGPLRVSYKLSGKYISEEGKYPGRLDFLKLCMYEQTKAHFLPTGKITLNWFPAPIVILFGTTRGVSGEMQSDAFGWTPMADFAKAEKDTLYDIGRTATGVAIESQEILDNLQAIFDKAFMPVHCAEVTVE